MLIKTAILGLLNPVNIVKEKYISSHWGRADLIWAVTGGGVPTPITYRRLGNKGVTGRKTGKLRTKPSSRVQSDNSKVPTGA